MKTSPYFSSKLTIVFFIALNFIAFGCLEDLEELVFVEVETSPEVLFEAGNNVTLSGRVLNVNRSISASVGVTVFLRGTQEIVLNTSKQETFDLNNNEFSFTTSELDQCESYDFEVFLNFDGREDTGERLPLDFGIDLSFEREKLSVSNDSVTLSWLYSGIRNNNYSFTEHGFFISENEISNISDTSNAGIVHTERLGPLDDNGQVLSKIGGLEFNTSYYTTAFVVNNATSCVSAVSEPFQTFDGWELFGFHNNNRINDGHAIRVGDYIYFGLGQENFAITSPNRNLGRIPISEEVISAIDIEDRAFFEGQGRGEAISFAIGDIIYYGLGATSSGEVLNDVWAYDTNSDSWSPLVLDPFPTVDDFGDPIGDGRSGAFVLTFADSAIIGGGFTSGLGAPFTTSFFSFNPSRAPGDRWRQVRSIIEYTLDTTGVVNFDDLVTKGAVAFTLNDVGYVGMWETINNEPLNVFWEYKNDGNWEKLEDAEFPGEWRSNPSVFVLNDVVYLGLGELETEGAERVDKFFDDFYRFDGMSWSADVPRFIGQDRSWAAAAAGNDEAFIFGGRADFGFSRTAFGDIFKYTPRQ